MGKCKRKRKCHSDRDTSVALYGEDCEQIKQKCITIADNTLPYTVSVNYKFFWTMPDYKETVNTVIKGCKSWNITQRIYWSINSGLRAELIIHKNYKIHTNHNSHWDICQKRNEKKREIWRWMSKGCQSARTMLGNFLLQRLQIIIHVKPIWLDYTLVYAPICYGFICYNSMYIPRESVVIFRTEKIWFVIANKWK